MKLLVENGAEVNAEGGKYGNALQAALIRGHEAIVKLLVENGAKVVVTPTQRMRTTHGYVLRHSLPPGSKSFNCPNPNP